MNTPLRLGVPKKPEPFKFDVWGLLFLGIGVMVAVISVGEGYSLTSLALAYEIATQWQSAQNAHHEALSIRKNIGQDACAIDNVSGLARASSVTFCN